MFPEPHRDNLDRPDRPTPHAAVDSSFSGLTHNPPVQAGVTDPLPASAPPPLALSELTIDQRSRMLRNLVAVVAVIEEFGEDLHCSVIQPLRQVSSDMIASEQSFRLLVLDSRDRLLDRALAFESNINDFTRLNQLISDYAEGIKEGISDVAQALTGLLEGNDTPHTEEVLHKIANQLFRISSADANAITPVLRQKIDELTPRESAA